MRPTTWLPWAALAVLVVGIVAFLVWPDGGERSVNARTRALAEEIRCPECQGLSAATSSAPTARAIRVDIRDQIEAGRSDAEIRQSMIDRYGESILLKPEGGGIGLLVWGLPVVGLVVGAAGLAFALWRWRAQPARRATDADERLVDAARHE